jgi:hypothetical protein
MPDFSGYNGDLIRAGTIAAVIMKVVYGGGTDGVLTPTKAGDAEMLKAEFTVLEGEFAKRKIFASWIVKGTTDGQKSMAERYNAMCKRIIASAKFLDPNDRTPETLTKYRIEYRDFDGLKFLAEIGIEPGRDGFEDKNVITRVIAKDSPLWGNRPPFDQNPPDPTSGGPTNGTPSGGAPPASISKPSWAS